ncbi:MAG: flavodoxin domain-containing protein [Candidatus Eisenbacteria bacterium]
MGAKILVAYASWAGTTADVAAAIASRLGDDGTADVRPAGEVADLSSYSGVVLGAAIRAGRPHRDARAFVARHCSRLAQLPVACFVVCLTMKDDTPENRQKARSFIDPVLNACPDMHPVDVGLFAGAVPAGREALAKLPIMQRIILGAMKSTAGDFRDWPTIDAWADGLRGRLVGDQASGVPSVFRRRHFE